jgi:DMSO/TMAO reductase YedYZ molybdopterin-dependent catalytic subunit
MRRIIEFFRRRPEVDPTGAEEPWVPEWDETETKLTRSKLEWARKGQFMGDGPRERSTDRLPPGQHLTEGWPILDIGIKPEIDIASWSLEIAGTVANPCTIKWDAFRALPQVEAVNDIHCVTSWSRYDNRWEGVRTRDIVDLASPLDGTRSVMLHGYDGYTTNLLLEDFADKGALVVHSWNGEPLTQDHGGPARLVVPHLYFWKSAKWLRRIEFLEDPEPQGFWEVGGYHDRGDPWLEQRYRWSPGAGKR